MSRRRPPAPPWAPFGGGFESPAQLAALGWLLLVAGYLLAVLPRLTAAQGAAVTGTGFGADFQNPIRAF